MIIVENVATADDTDFLQNTDLANIPSPGILSIYAASTQNDTLLTITGPGSEPVVRSQAMVLRANAEIRMDEDITYMIPVSQGGRYVIAVDVQTAATFRIRAVFQDLQDLGLS